MARLSAAVAGGANVLAFLDLLAQFIAAGGVLA